MALQVYPAGTIVRNLIHAFLPNRKLRLAARGLAPDMTPRQYTEDEIISDMEMFSCVRIDAARETPRGARDWVVIFVLSGTGKLSAHSPDLRRLLEGVDAEKTAREGRLDELIVVAEDAFFTKKNLTDVIADLKTRAPDNADPTGTGTFYSAYPYANFSYVLPECKSVPPHRLMTDAEVDAILASERLTFRDFGVVFTTDPPIVWNGGREGQLCEITRDSQTAGHAYYYRRIERGPY